MRIVILLILITFFNLSCSRVSDSINLDNEKEVRKALAYSWEAKYIDNYVVEKTEIKKGTLSILVLKANGTYENVSSVGTKQKGKWSYAPTTHKLIFDGDESLANRINKLTSKELITTGYTSINDEILDSMRIISKRL